MKFDEIVVSTPLEAQSVLQSLKETIEYRNQATVSDLYELVGIKSKYTDEKWGWKSLEGVGYKPVSEGYLLDLPKPEQLD